ncbi:MarR family winged helix-turn-helix transcriptional regulator [Cupriavidus sp. 8B]
MKGQNVTASKARAIAKNDRTALAGEKAPAAQPPRLAYLIGRADRIVKKRLGEVLAQHGLSTPQFTALSVLHARGPSSNAQLADRSLISPQAANEVVKTMEARDWIVRQPDPANGRIVLLSLTETARALLTQCDETIEGVEREMLEGIDTEHAALLCALLQQCTRNLR